MHRTQEKLAAAVERQKTLMIEIDAAKRALLRIPRGPEHDAADRAYMRMRWSHSDAKADAAMWRKELRRMERGLAMRAASQAVRTGA